MERVLALDLAKPSNRNITATHRKTVAAEAATEVVIREVDMASIAHSDQMVSQLATFASAAKFPVITFKTARRMTTHSASQRKTRVFRSLNCGK